MSSEKSAAAWAILVFGLGLSSGSAFALTAPRSRDARPASEEMSLATRAVPMTLVAVGRIGPGDRELLERALDDYRRAADPENTAALEEFLRSHPGSPWAASLEGALGRIYRQSGLITRSVGAFESAWAGLKASREDRVRPVADEVLGELAELTAALGRVDRLSGLLEEARGRSLRGYAYEQVAGATRGLGMMREDPGGSFRCGPLALEYVSRALYPGRPVDPRILEYRSSSHGTTLAEIARLARQAGIDMVAVSRDPGVPPSIPAILHWKSDHFAAAVEEHAGRFLIRDLTSGDDRWISRRVLDEETSGYMLVLKDAAARFRAVSEEDTRRVRGQGATGNPDPGATTPKHPKKPRGCGPGKGMPAYDFHLAIVSLNVTDEPLGYSPPRGPEMGFGVTYNSREAFQPTTFTFSNLGPRWTFNWSSYVNEVNPSAPGQPARVAELGGGSVTYSGAVFQPDGSIIFAPDSEGDHARLARVTVAGVVQYRRDFPDGSRETYSVSDGATSNRKYFLTSVADPIGNTSMLGYVQTSNPPSLRLTSITDPLGQVTRVQYSAADPNRISGIVDPFGRSAAFSYDAAGMLSSITDAIGMTSTFTYGPNAASPAAPVDFMNAMTTPYGTTSFSMGEDPSPAGGFTRWIVAADPLGRQERVEFRHQAPGIDPTTTDPVPSGFLNNFLQYRNTFYWDQKAMQSYDSGDPDRYKNATSVYHWLHESVGSQILASSVLETIQPRGMRRTWFAYPGQASPIYVGVLSEPSVVSRVLDDGTLQETSFDYDSAGRVQATVDPAGRAFALDYAQNGIDVTAVRRFFDDSHSERIAALTYDSRHLPLTYTDPAGNTTAFAYNANGQITSVTRPDQSSVTAAYDSQGYLTSVSRSGGYRESLTYDAFGRVATWTGTDGYRLAYEYDALDRLTRITYPDGTFESFVFDRLDVVEQRDRMGRVTSFDVDAGGDVVAEIGADGRATRYEWCGCGSLESMTDPRGNRTEWILDALGRTEEKRVNDRTKYRLAFDSAGRLAARWDARGQSILVDYNTDDTVGSLRHVGAFSPTPDVAVKWDRTYRRIGSVTDGTGTTSYSYFPVGAAGAGRIATVTYPPPSHTVAFAYDALGRPVSRSLDGKTTSVAYDSLDRPVQITSPLGTLATTYVGATNRVASSQYAGRMAWSFAYDALESDFSLASQINTALSTNALVSKFEMGRDAAHDQILTVTQTDPANPGGKFFQMAYDPVGQLLHRPQTMTSAPSSQILHDAIFGYDETGNRTSEQVDATVTTATYDAENRLRSIHRGLSQSALSAMRAARSAAREEYRRKHPGTATEKGGAR